MTIPGRQLPDEGASQPRRAAPPAPAADAQAFLAGVLDSLPTGVAAAQSIRDASGRIVDFRWSVINTAGERIVGKPREKVIGRRILEVSPDLGAAGLFEAYARVVETGEPFRDERCYPSDEIDRWVDIVAVKFGDGFSVTFADLTPRNVAERAPVEGVDRYRRVIDAVQDVTEQRDRERQVAYRDAMLQALSEATRQFLVCEDLPSAVEYALATLGRVIDADRVYVCENQPEDGTGRLLTCRRYEWCGPATPAAAPSVGDSNPRNLPREVPVRRSWRDELSAGRHVSERIDVPPDGGRPFPAGQGVHSTLVVPIMIRGEWWGLIGFDDFRQGRLWSEGEVSILMALAASVGGAFAREQSEAKLEHDSLHDALTGLPNRVLFHDRVERCIRRTCADPDYRFAVLFLDLDRFKVINDSLGHAAGDALLATVADRLRACVRGADGQDRHEYVVARLGGDEFTVLLGEFRDPDDANRIADRILAEVGRPIQYDGHEITTTPSIGLVIGGSEYASAKDVLRDADAAMYKAKTSGKNRCAVFDATLHAAAVDRLRLEGDLRHALPRGELLLHYQPVFALESRQLVGFEALVRWRHDGRLFAPEEFLPIAEDTGLIVPIGRWVLEQACRQLAAWRAAHATARSVGVGVNISRRQLADPTLVPHVVQALADARLDPAALKLEVTESVIMNDGDAARNVLGAVKRVGARVSMDDFGTGHSSLGSLHKFPLDELKIDRSFVQSLQGRRDAAAVVQAIVTLAQNLGMTVVAEGVERTEQLAFLQAVGCDAAQGFLFAEPLPPEGAERLLAAAAPPTLPAAA